MKFARSEKITLAVVVIVGLTLACGYWLFTWQQEQNRLARRAVTEESYRSSQQVFQVGQTAHVTGAEEDLDLDQEALVEPTPWLGQMDVTVLGGTVYQSLDECDAVEGTHLAETASWPKTLEPRQPRVIAIEVRLKNISAATRDAITPSGNEDLTSNFRMQHFKLDIPAQAEEYPDKDMTDRILGDVSVPTVDRNSHEAAFLWDVVSIPRGEERTLRLYYFAGAEMGSVDWSQLTLGLSLKPTSIEFMQHRFILDLVEYGANS